MSLMLSKQRLPKMLALLQSWHLSEYLQIFAQKVAFLLGPLSDDERTRLQQWYAANPDRAQRGGTLYRWAFISWEK